MRVDTLRPELKTKIEEWILSFYHLDPRYKILTFFNFVATEGADNITDDQQQEESSYLMMRSNAEEDKEAAEAEASTELLSRSNPPTPCNTNPSSKCNKSLSLSASASKKKQHRNLSTKSNSSSGEFGTGSVTSLDSSSRARINKGLMSRPSARNISPNVLALLSRIFNATSILTVWRPCSNDAMRKMMEGTGVGKGLDIKGKSAKKGTLSAFVPFLQIFKNPHKQEIQPITVGANMRVYYKDERMRDHVYRVLEDFLHHGPKHPKPKLRKTTKNATTKVKANPDEEEEGGMEIVQNGSSELPEIVDIIESNLDLNKSTKKCLEESAVEMFGGTSRSKDQEGGGNSHDKTKKVEPRRRSSVTEATTVEEEMIEDTTPEVYVGDLQHKDPSSHRYIPDKPFKKMKKYAKNGYYGIECSQRLFWFATVEKADIERDGTGTETGRPSLPGFQDANMKTLKVAQAQIPKPSPMPCVIQDHSYADCLNHRTQQKEFKRQQKQAAKQKKKEDTMKEDCEMPTAAADDEESVSSSEDDDPTYNPLDECLDPKYLCMAYEEQGTIKPVVSDFDGFLLGWRREALWFGCNLPRDQEELMLWCVKHIEDILDEQEKNPTDGDTWTIRWLEVMKKEAARGFHVEMPEYGFGDPKSTSIMEHAATKLIKTGAVRHGSECFNYQFPQEIDDMFLLISDTLKPVPWKYVKVDELQAILSQKIREGFVFPLNPKWILCDPGWKKIYDDLMASDALYADLSKDVWYPHHTGIRDRIEEVYKKHPNGFQPCTDMSIATSGMAAKRCPADRRGSTTNLLRDALGGGADALTGNAVADLAQMELDDFTDRSKGQARKSLTIHELKELDGDTKFSGNASSLIRISEESGSKNQNKSSSISNSTVQFDGSAKDSRHTPRRPSGVSSVGSHASAYSTASLPSSSHTAGTSKSGDTTPKSIRKKFGLGHLAKKIFSKTSRMSKGLEHAAMPRSVSAGSDPESSSFRLGSSTSSKTHKHRRTNSAGNIKKSTKR